MKSNPHKCNLLVASCNPVRFIISSITEQMKSCFDLKLIYSSSLGVMYLLPCSKASQKLRALSKITNNMDLEKQKCLMKTFITPQFNYCPLIWMFHSRELNDCANQIHERSLRLVYKNATYDKHLQKDNSVWVQHRNLKFLAIEIFKGKNELAPNIMKEVFQIREHLYNFRSETSTFMIQKVRTAYCGFNSGTFLATRICEQVPEAVRCCSSLKEKIKKNWLSPRSRNNVPVGSVKLTLFKLVSFYPNKYSNWRGRPLIFLLCWYEIFVWR